MGGGGEWGGGGRGGGGHVAILFCTVPLFLQDGPEAEDLFVLGVFVSLRGKEEVT